MPVPTRQNSEPFFTRVKIDFIRSAPGMQLRFSCSQLRISSSILDVGLEYLERIKIVDIITSV